LFGLLPLGLMAQIKSSSGPLTCSGSFVGDWRPVSSEGGNLQILDSRPSCLCGGEIGGGPELGVRR
jgi:hypothetical protein